MMGPGHENEPGGPDLGPLVGNLREKEGAKEGARKTFDGPDLSDFHDGLNKMITPVIGKEWWEWDLRFRWHGSAQAVKRDFGPNLSALFPFRHQENTKIRKKNKCIPFIPLT